MVTFEMGEERGYGFTNSHTKFEVRLSCVKSARE